MVRAVIATAACLGTLLAACTTTSEESGDRTPPDSPLDTRSKDRCKNMAANNSGDLSESKFLTIAEVAAKMRVSKMTVYRLVHGGDLPAVRVGRSFRVTEDDVNEYLRNSFYNAG